MRSWPKVGLLGVLAAMLVAPVLWAGGNLDGRPLGPFVLTYYEIAQEHGPGDVPVYSRNCKGIIARTGRDFHDDLSLQGSGMLADGRLLNFEQRCNCAQAGHAGVRACYGILDRGQYPWGRGALWHGQYFWLQPFRSVAVDPGTIPIGQVLYLPELAGYPLPDGTLFNGCVRAEDTGGAIKGAHLDWFIGAASGQAWLRTHPPPRQVTAYADSPRCNRAFP